MDLMQVQKSGELKPEGGWVKQLSGIGNRDKMEHLDHRRRGTEPAQGPESSKDTGIGESSRIDKRHAAAPPDLGD